MTGESGARPDAALLGCGEAPAKLILLGEHFVVHGVPAIALPLPRLRTRVEVRQDQALLRATVDAPGAPGAGTAQRLLERALALLALPAARPWRVTVSSTIPIGHGLGSSASLAVALLRALAAARGAALDAASLNRAAHDLETLTHGTPSGLDDTVVTLEAPIWFCRDQQPLRLVAPAGLRFVLASSGAPGATGEAVARVRARKQQQPQRFAELCDAARRTVETGLQALRGGDARRLGACMDESHALLQQLGVSTPALDALVAAARRAGACGAKLTGAGCGGFVVALVPAGAEDEVLRALQAAGAGQTLDGRVFDAAPADEEQPR